MRRHKGEKRDFVLAAAGKALVGTLLVFVGCVDAGKAPAGCTDDDQCRHGRTCVEGKCSTTSDAGENSGASPSSADGKATFEDDEPIPENDAPTQDGNTPRSHDTTNVDAGQVLIMDDGAQEPVLDEPNQDIAESPQSTGTDDCASVLGCVEEEACPRPSWICDGVPDCSDASDEPPDCADRCGEHRTWCAPDARCLGNSTFCDGVLDCSDESDEPGDCAERCYEQGGFWCGVESRCLYDFSPCDGIPECSDGSDESGCPECNPYERRCSANHEGLEICNEEGLWETTTCEYQCDDSEGGVSAQCLLCAPNEFRCQSGQRETCSVDGQRWQSPVACSMGCGSNGNCACDPGTETCSDTVLLDCDSAGLRTDVECPSACKDGQCVVGECTPRDHECDGLTMRACATTGEWETVADCESCDISLGRCAGPLPDDCSRYRRCCLSVLPGEHVLCSNLSNNTESACYNLLNEQWSQGNCFSDAY